MLRRFSTLGAFLASVLMVMSTAIPSSAQEWPQRNVRWILPLGAGSGVDIAARLFADRLSARWHHTVVVENRPGGDGVLAINALLNARDDHVMMFAPTSSFTAYPLQHETMPYNPADMVPVVRVANTIVVMAVPSSLPVNSVGDLFKLSREQPGKLNFTTATGVIDFLFDAYLKTNNIPLTRIPYRDTVHALIDLAENRIQGYIGAMAIVQPHLQAGRIKLIAVTNSERPESFQPKVPTIKEQGFPDLTFDGLTGLFANHEMSAAVRSRIAADVQEVAKDPQIVSRLTATGQVVNPGSGEDFAKSIAEQQQSTAAIGKILGIKMAK